ncbi:auxin response factor 1 [Sesbania bispinosa]|nr:auxin response factor 1 [Sesbania bispinosa]
MVIFVLGFERPIGTIVCGSKAPYGWSSGTGSVGLGPYGYGPFFVFLKMVMGKLLKSQ